MITAIEARKFSDNANDNKWVKELEEIEKEIKNSFERGYYSVKINKTFENKTITKLKEAGYQVKYENYSLHIDYKVTIISW